MNPFRKIANSLMNWWKGETAPEVSDSTELTGGVMTLNSPSFLESMGLSRRRRHRITTLHKSRLRVRQIVHPVSLQS